MTVLTALKAAAAALLSAAPEPLVRRTLMTLLAEETRPNGGGEEAGPRGNGTLRPEAVPEPKVAVATHRSVASAAAGWSTLRPRVRSAMREQGLNYAGLAAATGYSRKTVASAVGSNAAPTRAMQAKLAAWLERAAGDAAEVSEMASAPFRGACTGAGAARRGNGSRAGAADASAPAQRGDSAATRVHAPASAASLHG